MPSPDHLTTTVAHLNTRAEALKREGDTLKKALAQALKNSPSAESLDDLESRIRIHDEAYRTLEEEVRAWGGMSEAEVGILTTYGTSLLTTYGESASAKLEYRTNNSPSITDIPYQKLKQDSAEKKALNGTILQAPHTTREETQLQKPAASLETVCKKLTIDTPQFKTMLDATLWLQKHFTRINEHYYLPGIEYMQWLEDELKKPSDKQKIPATLTDGNYHFCAGTLIGARGTWRVPCVLWSGSSFNRNRHWLEFVWDSRYRVVFLER